MDLNIKMAIVVLLVGYVTFFRLNDQLFGFNNIRKFNIRTTRSSWFNCALRDDEAVYWVSIGHYEAVAVGN